LRKRIVAIILLLVICGLAVLLLVFNGSLWFNMPLKSQYPVRGVDVSNYQGEIDWDILSGEDIQFAFIKATEGSTFVDPYFAENWQGASETDLIIGGYHFFSFESAGETQAENVIATLPLESGTLPPVVDVEYYGDFAKDPPDYEKVTTELRILLNRLEEYYGVPPIIYSTYAAYNEYLSTDFISYPLWIRDVRSKPNLTNGASWLFWQYSDHGYLDGYVGDERYIDLNVFNGTIEELRDTLIEAKHSPI